MLRDKKGVMNLPFGMIFSIFLIAVIIAIAFYAISYFLDLKRCSVEGLYFKDLKDKVNSAWQAETVRDDFSGSLPGRIDSVCFGEVDTGRGEEASVLRDRYRGQDANVFLYPPDKSCVPFNKIKHIDIEEFKCFPVERGSVTIRLEKGSYDAEVKIK